MEDAAPGQAIGLRRELGLPDLVMFNVTATLGVQLIPVFAHVGPVALPLHLFAALLFFVPCALVIAKLSRLYPGEGGFYLWTLHAFGPRHAFFCGWSYWLSVLLFLPILLLTAAGIASEAVAGPASGLADNSLWQISAALLILWFTTAANIFGLRLSKWLSNAAAILIYAGGALVSLAAVLFWIRHGSATRFTFRGTFSTGNLGLWAQIAFAYTGLELGSLLGGEIRNPKRTLPRAVWVSALVICAGYVAGCSALLLVQPPAAINPISGFVQVANLAGPNIGLSSLGFFTAALLFVGLLGKLSAWNGGVARLPFTIGIHGAFPAIFTRVHPRWKTPWVALVVQGVVCSLFLLLAQAGDTVRNGWQLLMEMEVLVTFVPFLYIFGSAWKFGSRWSALSGLLVTLLAIALALLPPENVSSLSWFEAKAVGGSILLMLVGWWGFGARRREVG